MTELDRFFMLLPTNGWEVRSDGAIREKKCYTRSGGHPCCPLERVYGQVYLAPESLVTNIMIAADTAEYRTPQILVIRQRLLKHCGLDE